MAEKYFLFIIVSLFLKAISCDSIGECTSIGCVHASAQLIRRINNDTDPCEDFYEFACGTFIKNTNTPDEKLTINTESVLIDELDGNLFRILSSQIKKDDTRPHKTAKNLYQTCMDADRLKEVESKELLELLDHLGGWPVLKKKNWNENDFSWEKTMEKLHQFVGIGESENIFRMSYSMKTQEKDKITQKIESNETSDDDDAALIQLYPEFMFEMAVLLGAEPSKETKQEMFDAFELGLALNQLLNGKQFSKRSTLTDVAELQLELDMIKWLELFDRFKLDKFESFIVNKNVHVYDNLKMLKETFKPRDFANYLLWRFVDFSSLLLHKEALDKVFRINKKTYGLLDKEQRWKFCTRMTNQYAELATGSLYIREYFSEDSRKAALKMANELIKEFKFAIKNAGWMNDETKEIATEKLDTLKVYMGYDQQLLDSRKVESYYGNPQKDFSKSFLLLAFQLNVHKTDKKFKHKFRNIEDWTEYAKPTSSKASYNSRDHTIYFAAAFLQPPNFDSKRPTSMNYGGIGAIIAHELTHCLDRFLEKIDSNSRQVYDSKVKCIVDQNSKFFDEDLKTNMNGEVTKTEDTADNGGVVLAYRAYKNWAAKNQEKQTTLIALDYTPEKLFWISYAQFYCSVQRLKLKESLFATKEVHSFDKFRVMGPLMNSRDFAHDFKCESLSNMNPDRERCSVW